MPKNSEKLLGLLSASKLKLKIFFLTIIFSGVFGVVGNSQAASYYVKNGGNDSLSGLDDANAWETIDKVQGTVTSGDTVYFRSQDTWEGANSMLDAISGVTYYGAGYGSGERATFRIISRVSTWGVVQIYVSDVTFEGFKIDMNNFPMIGIGIGYTNPSQAGDISNITVRNCEITGGPTEDGDIVDGDGDGKKYRAINTSAYTSAAANRPPSGGNWATYWEEYSGDRVSEGAWQSGFTNYLGREWYYAMHISSWASDKLTSNVTIENNLIHHVGHEGIAIYPRTGGTGHVSDILVRSNVVHNTGLARSPINIERPNPLDIANDSDNVTLEFNYLYDNPGGITIASYGLVCYGAPSPDNVIIRYNMLNNSRGISISGYFCQEGIDGSGSIYGNIVAYGSLTIGAHDFKGKSWKIYNNTFMTDYSAGKGSYVLDCYPYRTPINTQGIEIKNNIFQGTGLNVVRDPWNFFGNIIHSNNLFYRTDSSISIAQTSTLKDVTAIPATSVSITHDASYTYFTKSGGVDWTTKFIVGDNVKWSGFANSGFNDRQINVLTVSADVIKAYKIYLDGINPTETALVTGESWQVINISADALQATWEPTAQIANPNFFGGALPTGFSGTYGNNLLPNTDYFKITSGDALNNGATLGSPFNGSINSAGISSPFLRPDGAYDIGAYEFQGADVTPPNSPANLSVL